MTAKTYEEWRGECEDRWPNRTAEIQECIDSRSPVDLDYFDGSGVDMVVIDPGRTKDPRFVGKGELVGLPLRNDNTGRTKSEPMVRLVQGSSGSKNYPDGIFEEFYVAPTVRFYMPFDCPANTSSENRDLADLLWLNRNMIDHVARGDSRVLGIDIAYVSGSFVGCGNTAVKLDRCRVGTVEGALFKDCAGHWFASSVNVPPEAANPHSIAVKSCSAINVGQLDITGDDDFENTLGPVPGLVWIEGNVILDSLGRNKLNQATRAYRFVNNSIINRRPMGDPRYHGLTITVDRVHSFHWSGGTIEGFGPDKSAIQVRCKHESPGSFHVEDLDVDGCQYAIDINSSSAYVTTRDVELGCAIESFTNRPELVGNFID